MLLPINTLKTDAVCVNLKKVHERVVQWPVARSMVSVNNRLSSIKTNRLSWYLTLVGANRNSAQDAKRSVVVTYRGFQ